MRAWLLFTILLCAANADALELNGKVCLDTPSPTRYSGQDLKEAHSGDGLPDKRTREERLKALQSRPLKFDGVLSASVDDGLFIELPKGKGLWVQDLDPSRPHKIRIKNGKGRIEQVIRFEFPDPKDPRVRVSQGSFYHTDLQINPAPKKCPWAG